MNALVLLAIFFVLVQQGHALSCFTCNHTWQQPNPLCESNNVEYLKKCDDAEKYCSVMYWKANKLSDGNPIYRLIVAKQCTVDNQNGSTELNGGFSCMTDGCNTGRFYLIHQSDEISNQKNETFYIWAGFGGYCTLLVFMLFVYAQLLKNYK